MFVQAKDSTVHRHKNGVALRQRRAASETLVQWQNGQRRWVITSELQGEIRLVSEGLDEVFDSE